MWYFVFFAFALSMIMLVIFRKRNPSHADFRSNLGIKGKGSMAVRLDRPETLWTQYESPTFVRRGLSLPQPTVSEQPIASVPDPVKKRKSKAKPSFTPADQAELASLLDHYQQGSIEDVAGSFEVVA